jgi:hypothetical protein
MNAGWRPPGLLQPSLTQLRFSLEEIRIRGKPAVKAFPGFGVTFFCLLRGLGFARVAAEGL